MPYFSQKKDYRILHWDLPLAGKCAAVVSDLHMGTPGMLFQKTWQRIKLGVQDKEFDAVIINGDLGDGRAFAIDSNNYIAVFIQEHIEELLDLYPAIPIIITRGNHDLAIPYQQMLEELTKKHPNRVYSCDILKMQDALFVHGDFTNHDPCNVSEIPRRLADEKRLQMFIRGGVEDYDRTTDKVHGRLRALLGDEFNDVKHVIVGHFHPKDPTINIIKNDFSGMKTHHMTGCSKTNRISTILKVSFGQNRVINVSECFRDHVSRLSADASGEGMSPFSTGR